MLGGIRQTLFKNSSLYVFLREIVKSFCDFFSLAYFRAKWRRRNRHNYTDAINKFPLDIVHVGKNTYGSLRIYSFKHPNEQLTIGNYCSIAGDVTFILGGNHPLNLFSTYPFSFHCHKPNFEIEDNSTKGPIIIDSDVWIGHGAIILSGVTIGQGAVIGAGSIVAKDVPPYSVFLGNKVVKFRFEQEIIDELIKIDFEKLTDDKLLEIEPLLYKEMTKNIAKEILQIIH